MYTRAQALASGSPVLNLTYLEPNHSLSPAQAFSYAESIRKEYVELRKQKSPDRSRRLLREKYAEFCSPQGFPRLFNMACEEEDSLEAVKALVELRNKVNSGEIEEEEGALGALYVAAAEKSKK